MLSLGRLERKMAEKASPPLTVSERGHLELRFVLTGGRDSHSSGDGVAEPAVGAGNPQMPDGPPAALVGEETAERRSQRSEAFAKNSLVDCRQPATSLHEMALREPGSASGIRTRDYRLKPVQVLLVSRFAKGAHFRGELGALKLLDPGQVRLVNAASGQGHG